MECHLSSNQSICIEMSSRLSYPSKTKHIIVTLNIVLLTMAGDYFKNPNTVYVIVTLNMVLLTMTEYGICYCDIKYSTIDNG